MLPKVLAILVIFVVHQNGAQNALDSPCPRLFQYEPTSPQPDRWYGIVTLLTETDLTGVWLRLMFDRPSLQLGNWVGQVSAREGNTEYLIKNREMTLKANIPQTVRFYVRYDTSQPPPKLVGFRLNARTICPEGVDESSTPTLELQTSNELLTTARVPVRTTTTTTQASTVNVEPQGQGEFNVNSSPFGDDDDFFPGDISVVNRTNQRPVSVGSNDNECGTIIHSKPLDSYSQLTIEGEYPWHAALYHTKGINLMYWCGGALISKKHVLTAAHCVAKWKTREPRDLDNFVVYLGKYYLNRFTKGIQERLIAEITLNPNYIPEKLFNDLAIVTLASPIEVTNYVRPVCLWQGSLDLNAVASKEGTVVGWGIDRNGRLTEQLAQTKLPVGSFEMCIRALPTFYPLFSSNTTYCTGFTKEMAVCNGDSGVGMYFPKQLQQNTVQWHLRGLVSFSIDHENRFRCDASHYVVYTDTAQYLDWIRQQIQQ